MRKNSRTIAYEAYLAALEAADAEFRAAVPESERPTMLAKAAADPHGWDCVFARMNAATHISGQTAVRLA